MIPELSKCNPIIIPQVYLSPKIDRKENMGYHGSILFDWMFQISAESQSLFKANHISGTLAHHPI